MLYKEYLPSKTTWMIFVQPMTGSGGEGNTCFPSNVKSLSMLQPSLHMPRTKQLLIRKLVNTFKS